LRGLLVVPDVEEVIGIRDGLGFGDGGVTRLCYRAGQHRELARGRIHEPIGTAVSHTGGESCQPQMRQKAWATSAVVDGDRSLAMPTHEGLGREREAPLGPQNQGRGDYDIQSCETLINGNESVGLTSKSKTSLSPTSTQLRPCFLEL